MKLHDVHAFGCPVHALQKKPADGMSTPRWERRSKRGMCVGMLERHVGSVPLVLNFETGNITAQWNVAFDDWFWTVAANVEDMMPDFHADEWSKMFRMSTCDMEGSEELEEMAKRPTQRKHCEVENDEMEEEELMRQQILQPNVLIKPTRLRSGKTHVQVTARTNQHSGKPSSPPTTNATTDSADNRPATPKHCKSPPTPNPNNKQGGEFGGDGETRAVAPAAEQGLHDLKLHKNTV